jgi:hypothetical protein
MEPGIQQAFFSARNRTMIIGVAERNIQSRRKTALSDSQRVRISAIVDHYMKEVYDVQGDKPLAFLNKETITVTEKQYYRSKHFPAKGQASTTTVKTVSFSEVESAAVADTAFSASGSELPPMISSTGQQSGEPSTAELFEMAKMRRAQGQVQGQAFGNDFHSTSLAELGLAQDNGQTFGQGQGDLVRSLMGSMVPASLPAPTLQQQVIIRDEAVQQYKEIESNLILYSADRDWTTTSAENRYNFSVTFDPGNRRSGGAGSGVASNRKFNNIIRIELVKAILPAESIDTLVYRSGPGEQVSNLETNILSYPQVLVHIDEFTANNYGTDQPLDTAFGILQYDANWRSDAGGQGKGYLAMIPKFLKCQRVFHPTPLATLQKLTVRLERPDGTLIDSGADTFAVASFTESTGLPVGSAYYTASGASEYIALRMSRFFSHFAMQRGDRLLIRGFRVVADLTGLGESQASAVTAAAQELTRFMNREEGHLVSDIGYSVGGATTYSADGWNTVGYANYVLIRSKYGNPEAGEIAPAPFGGSVVVSELALDRTRTAVAEGQALNMMRQTQLVFRIITRELDATTQLRPDNT